MISLIIPTRDQADLLDRCLRSIRGRSTYPDYEILVIDNGSTDPKALRLIEGLEWSHQTRVIRHPGPFNFAAMINRAAREARGALLCLLNNDTEVISPDWMETMSAELMKEKVGVVGALLLFPDGSIQHAGDVVGGGVCVRHLQADPGPDPRDVDAVTGACLMTRRDLFLELGGLDEVNFPVAFNDTDYCLKVKEVGHRVICTPRARLLHHEMKSRGRTWKPWDLWRLYREKHAFRKRWSALMKRS